MIKMDKKICFILDQNKLYFDNGLIYFNDTPMLFVCKDEDGCFYLALCVDLENLEYLVVNISTITLWKMLTQRLTMREAMLDSDHFWSVVTGDVFSDDTIELHSIEDINYDFLPVEGAVFEAITDKNVDYIEKITSKYLNEIVFDYLGKTDDFSESFLSKSGTFIESVNNIAKYLDIGCLINNLKSISIGDSEMIEIPYNKPMERNKDCFKTILFDDALTTRSFSVIGIAV